MKHVLKFSLLFIVAGLFSLSAYAQTTISGAVIDSEYNQGLMGATVVVEGTTNGTVTDASGEFSIDVSESGTVTLTISFVGYATQTVSVEAGGKTADVGEIQMLASTLNIMEINVIADRAKERETPVAFSNVKSEQIENVLGSQDLPMVLNITPGVYATMQGGGAGDARINVRGFDQRNVAVMINGVPMNDMENGWVYWSNWDGIADATSSIQLQRGLSAVNLATPSVGGTMNILTSPAEHNAGGSVKFEYGSGNFMKTTVSANTGLINDKFALSVNGVRKTGNGVINGTWTDAWAYYVGATYNASDKHRFELFAMGAPQRHGQNLYKQNIASYSHDVATDMGLDAGALDKFAESVDGRLYNENVSDVDATYTAKQWWNGKEHDRYSPDFINERENFFHKPLVNLNWYARWTEKVSQYTTLYYSGGTGGGTGTYGSVNWDYSGPSRIVDYNSTVAEHAAADTSFGILRNSRNDQWTIGALSRVKVRFTDNLKGQVGIDWRTASIDHYREVRDLLGGDFFVYTGNDFDTGDEVNKVLGDKIAYYNTNTVDWFGYFAQLEYSTDKITAYGTFGNSFIKYSFTDHFTDDGTGNELYSESDAISGFQVKGGFSYRPTSAISVFANYGYITKVPIFDNVINDGDGSVTPDPENEIFNAFEVGASFIPNRTTEVKVNFYNTSWNNRSNLRRVTDQDGNDVYIFLSGMNQKHVGVELEGQIKPHRLFAVGGFASIGNWYYSDDVQGTFRDYDDTGVGTDVEFQYNVKDLKVGDAPQLQFGVNAFVYPVKNSFLQFNFKYNGKHFAAWDPFSRTGDDRAQVWETPAYFLVDLHAGYTIKTAGRYKIAITGHVFNLLDEIYIQDAVDNSSYNSYMGDADEFSHTANAAEVYLGLPRTFNVGVKFTF